MSYRLNPPRRVVRCAPAALLALVLAACSAAPGSTPAASPATPSAAPTPTPSQSGSPPIAHPGGAGALVLRFEEGGGFVMPAFAATQFPIFSLYGDGTVIYRPSDASPEEQKPGEPIRFPAARVATMTEDQVQALLKAALVDGALATARARYDSAQIADAPTAIFTLHANGLDKMVAVYALGIETDANPDSAARAAMATFAGRLRAFEAEVKAGRATAAGSYAPDRFRASLMQTDGADGPFRSWPWPTFGPESFLQQPAGDFGSLPSRAVSALDVSLLGIDRIAGGVSGIGLLAPDGTTRYTLSLRPLLPDEAR